MGNESQSHGSVPVRISRSPTQRIKDVPLSWETCASSSHYHTQTTSRLHPEPLLSRQYAHQANTPLSSGFLTVTVASELTHRASQSPTIDKQDIMSDAPDAQESSDTSAPVSEISSREHALLVAALSSLKSGKSLSCCSIFDDC